jgi:acyl carrier protein
VDSHEQVVQRLIDFIVENDPLAADQLPFPRDESLYERGILDSTAVIELVAFIEQHWSIEIDDDEITVEKMGSLNKMAKLTREKVAAVVGAPPSS